MSKKIWIGNDHGGYALKQKIVEYLTEHGLEYHDAGTFSGESVKYPCYAAKVASAVSSGEADRGILICSTGIGMSIAANKFKGVRASMCTSALMGEKTRAHNDSNILCLGGKITGEWEAIKILEAWLNTEYEGGRHDISVGMIKESEETTMTGKTWTKEQN